MVILSHFTYTYELQLQIYIKSICGFCAYSFSLRSRTTLPSVSAACSEQVLCILSRLTGAKPPEYILYFSITIIELYSSASCGQPLCNTIILVFTCSNDYPPCSIPCYQIPLAVHYDCIPCMRNSCIQFKPCRVYLLPAFAGLTHTFPTCRSQVPWIFILKYMMIYCGDSRYLNSQLSCAIAATIVKA